MTNTEQFVELGDEVEDTVTGFKGIVVAATTYLNGCRRLCIAPPAEDGKYQDERFLDEPQLVVTRRSAYLPPVRKEAVTATGGDRLDCPPRESR